MFLICLENLDDLQLFINTTHKFRQKWQQIQVFEAALKIESDFYESNDKSLFMDD